VSARTVDVLIFIPLIPAIPVVAFWVLPWERWIPKIIPNKIIGPYLLYCAFAIWHFKQSWWIVSMAGLAGIAVSTMAIFEARKARKAKEARDWPVAEGDVLQTSRNRDPDGVLKVNLTYTYKVHDERFGGSESFTFASEHDAERFESGCRQQKLKVHYRQDEPEICVLDRDAMP
jgi:hypothetical protein